MKTLQVLVHKQPKNTVSKMTFASIFLTLLFLWPVSAMWQENGQSPGTPGQQTSSDVEKIVDRTSIFLKSPMLNETGSMKIGTARMYLTLAELWQMWKTIHGRSYHSDEEESYRFNRFVENYHRVEQHNERFRKGLETFDIELNQFADMLEGEVKQKMNGFRPRQQRLLRRSSNNVAKPENDIALPFEHKPNVHLPNFIDWRRENAVTQVKDQGQCGCCWAFSTTGSLEAAYKLRFGKLISFSEQNLVDCSKSYGNDGCGGGIMDDAFHYVQQNGIDSEKIYPFVGKDEKCQFMRPGIMDDYTAIRYVDIPVGDEEALAQAVALKGPVAVAIDASHESLQYYTEGVYADAKCGSSVDSLDHAVLVVGYGIDENTGHEYWLVKNSWSSRWGEQGYVRIAKNNNNMCGIATMASYPVFI